ncbi:MAG TPA: exonuclease domain-containing protein [Saprospiraceae bacterium]|nr:exonuclease domain-containing protein [Saprospiraceae bacterium]
MKYSILDLETTGLFPAYHDKIVEISLISIDENGSILDSYQTLVNPNRDVGATRIHGITAEMVVDAPSFSEISLHILSIIDNSVVVGHNVNFDINFLNNELLNTGISDYTISGLCTIELSKILSIDAPKRNLEALCNFFDIENENAHTAYGDCHSTKELFLKLYNIYKRQFGIDHFIENYYNKYYLKINNAIELNSRIEHKRTNAIDNILKNKTRLHSMILRLPETSLNQSLPIQQYLDILDKILEDRIVTEDEQEKLHSLSKEFDLSQISAFEIHEEYLRRLIRVYLLDGEVSEIEMADLANVALLLGLSEKLDLIINLETAKIPTLENLKSNNKNLDLAGQSVCFTGELLSKIGGKIIERKQAHTLAHERGLIIKEGVSKKLDLLVVANPYTQSGKAKLARELNIKIIAEPVFWNMLGVSVD